MPNPAETKGIISKISDVIFSLLKKAKSIYPLVNIFMISLCSLSFKLRFTLEKF